MMRTLEEHIKDIEPELRELILEIAEISKIIRTGFVTNRGKAGTRNVYGEEQAQMDKWANTKIIEDLCKIDSVASISSEEESDVIRCNEDGKYSVMMDPLDGSSLLDIDLTVGTIIGIQLGDDPFRSGKKMAASLYILYGPLTVLTYTVGNGVHSFVLDKSEEYVLDRENIKIPEGKLYSPGGLREKWSKKHSRYIEELENRGYKLRYSGCFVADVHQILHKGGVFTYPALEDKPEGKLRLLFEANPMGFIVDNAGGRVSDGNENILEKKADRVDLRVPLYIGGSKEIQMIESM